MIIATYSPVWLKHKLVNAGGCSGANSVCRYLHHTNMGLAENFAFNDRYVGSYHLYAPYEDWILHTIANFGPLNKYKCKKNGRRSKTVWYQTIQSRLELKIIKFCMNLWSGSNFADILSTSMSKNIKACYLYLTF